MIKIFWYRYFKYPTLMNDADTGIKSFTERTISENLKILRSKISNLNSEVSTNAEHNPEYENIIIPDIVLKDNRRKRFIIPIFLLVLFLAEGFLNYISILILIPGGLQSPWLFLFIRLAAACVLTIGSIMILEYFFEVFLHEKIIELKKKYGIDYDSEYSNKDLIIWTFMALFILTVVGFIVEKRANAIESGQYKDLGYYGLIMLSLILPIFGGRIALEWKRSRKICNAALGKNRWLTQVKQSESDKLDVKSKFIKGRDKIIADLCSKYWKKINDFKTVKLAFQRKQGGTVEDIGRHKVIVDDFKAYQKYIEESLQSIN